MEYIKLPVTVTRRTCEHIRIKDKTWFYPLKDSFGKRVDAFLEYQEIDEAVDVQLIPLRYDIYVIVNPDRDLPVAVETFCSTVGESLTKKYNIKRWIYEGYLKSEEDTRIIFHFRLGGKK